MSTKQSDPDPSSRKSRRRCFAFYELPVAVTRTTNGAEKAGAAGYAAAWKQKPTWLPNPWAGAGLSENVEKPLSEY